MRKSILSMWLEFTLVLLGVFALVLAGCARPASAPVAPLPGEAPAAEAPELQAPMPEAPAAQSPVTELPKVEAPVAEVPAAAAFDIYTMSKVGLGDFLIDSKGMTLYYFARDTVGKSNATEQIIKNWPIFRSEKFNVPSTIMASDFGMITRDDGQIQTTYKGMPLYHFAGDKAPGDTNGQGLNNVWFVINPDTFVPIGAQQELPAQPKPARSYDY